MAIDFERIVGEAPYESSCTYCLHLIHPDDALQAPCGHFWCSSCIRGLIDKGFVSCPLHFTPVEPLRPLRESNNLFFRYLSSRVVVCVNHNAGCQWRGEFSEVRRHEANCAVGHCQCCVRRVAELSETVQTLQAARDNSHREVAALQAALGESREEAEVLEGVHLARIAELECARTDEAQARQKEVAALESALRESARRLSLTSDALLSAQREVEGLKGELVRLQAAQVAAAEAHEETMQRQVALEREAEELQARLRREGGELQTLCQLAREAEPPAEQAQATSPGLAVSLSESQRRLVAAEGEGAQNQRPLEAVKRERMWLEEVVQEMGHLPRFGGKAPPPAAAGAPTRAAKSSRGAEKNRAAKKGNPRGAGGSSEGSGGGALGPGPGPGPGLNNSRPAFSGSSSSSGSSVSISASERGADGPKKCMRTLKGHWGHIKALVFEPYGFTLWSASSDGTIRSWKRGHSECVIGTPRGFLGLPGGMAMWGKGHAGGVKALVVHGNRLWSGGDDKTIKCWSQRRCLATLKGHTGAVLALQLGPDGSVWSGGQDRTIRKWVDDTCQEVLSDPQMMAVRALAIEKSQSPYCPYSVFSGSDDLTIRRWVEKKCVAKLEGHTGPVCTLVFAPDGALWSGGMDHTLREWEHDVCTRTWKTQEIQDSNGVFALAFDSKGLLWSASNNGAVKGWRHGTCVASMRGDSKRVCALAIASDGSVWSGGHGKTIKGWR